MEVIRRVHSPLEQNPVGDVKDELNVAETDTNVLTAYLKNSVMRFVEPLRVIAWRVGACFVPAMMVVAQQSNAPVCT